MSQVVEAIFSDGALKPLGELGLVEGQHVRLVVEPLVERTKAAARLRDGIRSMQFSLSGKLPNREELHDRV